MDWSRFPKQLAIWSVVCIISAAPSFVLGLMVHDARPEAILGMMLGVGLFIAGYTLTACTTLVRRLQANRIIRRTMQITYGLRLLQSLGFFIPGVMLIDMVAGAISLGMVNAVVGELVNLGSGPSTAHGLVVFFHATLTTIAEGVLLNVVLLFLFGLIGACVWVYYRGLRAAGVAPPIEDRDPAKFCIECGYDLRASADNCPECGQPIPELVRTPTENEQVTTT